MRSSKSNPLRREEPAPERGPTPTQSFSDDFSSTVRAAAKQVAEHLPGELRDGPDEYRVLGRLDSLVEALVSDTRTRASDYASGSDVAGFQRLLDLLYTQIVQSWTKQLPSKLEMLRFLHAFQRVRDEVVPRRAEHSGFSWTVPESADLVVEFAHDLRSPLTSIIFLTESLQRGQGGAISDLQKRQLGIIYSAALSMVTMASDVIELTRGGTSLIERDPSRFSVAELFESIRDMLNPIAEEKGVELRMTLPEVDQRLGHPVALSRILLNVVSNALRFTDVGFVEVAARATGTSSITFSVRDTGPGIDEEAESHLFEPLRRNANNNRFGFSGSGLGLAISRRLVTSLGGELEYVTSRGSGTIFYFQIDLPPASPPYPNAALGADRAGINTV